MKTLAYIAAMIAIACTPVAAAGIVSAIDDAKRLGALEWARDNCRMKSIPGDTIEALMASIIRYGVLHMVADGRRQVEAMAKRHDVVMTCRAIEQSEIASGAKPQQRHTIDMIERKGR